MSDLELVEVEALLDEETKKIKQYVVWDYYRAGSKDGFDVLEEARDELLKRMKKNPFDTNKRYIVEIKEVFQNWPKAEVETRILDVTKYIEDEQKRIESNES